MEMPELMSAPDAKHLDKSSEAFKRLDLDKLEIAREFLEYFIQTYALAKDREADVAKSTAVLLSLTYLAI